MVKAEGMKMFNPYATAGGYPGYATAGYHPSMWGMPYGAGAAPYGAGMHPWSHGAGMNPWAVGNQYAQAGFSPAMTGSMWPGTGMGGMPYAFSSGVGPGQ